MLRKGELSDRDEMAIAALQGMLAAGREFLPKVGSSEEWRNAMAEQAYRLADAMILARNEK